MDGPLLNKRLLPESDADPGDLLLQPHGCTNGDNVPDLKTANKVLEGMTISLDRRRLSEALLLQMTDDYVHVDGADICEWQKGCSHHSNVLRCLLIPALGSLVLSEDFHGCNGKMLLRIVHFE